MFKFLWNLLKFLAGIVLVIFTIILAILLFAGVLISMIWDKYIKHRPSPMRAPSGKITRSKRKKWRETHPQTHI